MAKTISCPLCFYHDALLQNENAELNTPEYLGSIYCPACESGINELDEKAE